MKRYVLVTSKAWHKNIFQNLSQRNEENWILISEKAEFDLQFLKEFKPDKIFIPHWSYIILEEIWSNYECIVFHMTDLPYGRGGSPLQNLIVNGKNDTMITALKVNSGLDTGDIYLKKPLSLSGTAFEIFERASPIIKGMIEEIIFKNLYPVPQIGEPVIFKRRKPEQSSIAELSSLNEIYDYIRMLDCEGYPHAFLETENLKLEFNNASLKNNEIIANVRIVKK